MRTAILGWLVLAAAAASWALGNGHYLAAAGTAADRQWVNPAPAGRALQTGMQAQGTRPVPAGAAAATRSGVVRVLMMFGNKYGANYNWSRDVQETYGWEVTTAGLTDVVPQCYIGGPMTVDTLITEIGDLSGFDCVAVMPGPLGSHNVLVNSPEALGLLQQADSLGLLLVGFCGGTRVLARADVIEGHRVTGAQAYLQDYLNAGAIWAGEPVPPVLDGNILTATRNQTTAWRVCELMRGAIDSLRAVR